MNSFLSASLTCVYVLAWHLGLERSSRKSRRLEQYMLNFDSRACNYSWSLPNANILLQALPNFAHVVYRETILEICIR